MEKTEGMLGPEDNKSPYVTGTSVPAIMLMDGIPVVAADTRGLKENKSKTLRPYLTTGSTALKYEDLARSIMARWGDVIPMAMCGDEIPMAMCKDVIRMAADLKDNKSSYKDDLFPLRTYYVTTGSNKDLARSTMARCVDVIPIAAADSRGLEDNKSSNEDDATLVALPYGDGIIMEADARVRGTMESLPSDVIQDILSRVPAESVIECKFVCKKWKFLISQSNFDNMHFSRYLNHLLNQLNNGNDNLVAMVEQCLIFACRIDGLSLYRSLLFHGKQPSDEKYIYKETLKRIYHPPMHEEPMFSHLVGSCNGLVCIFHHHNWILDPIYICNPLTREYVYLPKLVVKKEDFDPDFLVMEEGEVDMLGKIACGFGYVRSTNVYKVVRIHYLDYEVANVEVYTLGSGCGWRAIGKVSHQLNTVDGGKGIYANDAIFWISGRNVVAFDLASEEFRLQSVPPRMKSIKEADMCGFVALGKHLCLYIDDTSHVEIWSLMKSGNWVMKFDIDYKALVGSPYRKLQPILLTKNGEIIFIFDESVLCCYDTKRKYLKIISDKASTDGFKAVDAIAHVNTFASLKTMGEKSKKYTVRPRRVGTPWDDVVNELDRVALGGEIDTQRTK